jgi:hypothetical protein
MKREKPSKRLFLKNTSDMPMLQVRAHTGSNLRDQYNETATGLDEAFGLACMRKTPAEMARDSRCSID